MHAQSPSAPYLALQAIDDGLTVLRVLLADAIEQKPVAPYIHDVQYPGGCAVLNL